MFCGYFPCFSGNQRFPLLFNVSRISYILELPNHKLISVRGYLFRDYEGFTTHHCCGKGIAVKIVLGSCVLFCPSCKSAREREMSYLVCVTASLTNILPALLQCKSQIGKRLKRVGKLMLNFPFSVCAIYSRVILALQSPVAVGANFYLSFFTCVLLFSFQVEDAINC